MRTSKSISTISYNTGSFLENKINEWKRSGFVEFAMWIWHDPEEDEKKGHFHVFLRPAKLIQTTYFEENSAEIDLNNVDKPLKMIGFRVSKESDWLLYALHDPQYLLEKGLEKQFVYSLDDIVSTCPDTLRDIISHCSDDRQGKLEYRIMQMVGKGMTWQEIVLSGFIPMRLLSCAKLFYDCLTMDDKKP